MTYNKPIARYIQNELSSNNIHVHTIHEFCKLHAELENNGVNLNEKFFFDNPTDIISLDKLVKTGYLALIIDEAGL